MKSEIGEDAEAQGGEGGAEAIDFGEEIDMAPEAPLGEGTEMALEAELLQYMSSLSPPIADRTKQRRASLPTLPKKLVPMSERVALYNDALNNPACVSGGKLIVSAVVKCYRQSPVIQAVEQYYKASVRYSPHAEGGHRFYGDLQVSRGVSQYVKNLVNYRDMSRLVDVAAAEDVERNAAKESALAAKESALAAKETAIANKETALAVKEMALAAKEMALAAKGTSIAANGTSIAAKGTSIAAKGTSLAAKGSSLAGRGTRSLAALL